MRSRGGPVCLVSAVSAVLVFLIASSYCTTEAGFLLFGLTVGSVWPYLLALYGAHISEPGR